MKKPDGAWIGPSGDSQAVKEVSGSLKDAEKLFYEIVKVCNVEHLVRPHPKIAGGLIAHIEEDLSIGLRSVSSSGPPTVDIMIDEWRNKIREIKFKT